MPKNLMYKPLVLRHWGSPGNKYYCCSGAYLDSRASQVAYNVPPPLGLRPLVQVEHITLRMGEGKCVLIGGLARMEVLEGRPFMFTFFVSNDVRLHPTDMKR